MGRKSKEFCVEDELPFLDLHTLLEDVAQRFGNLVHSSGIQVETGLL